MNLDHFDELLESYLLGELSEEQSAQLQVALQTDSAARLRFVQNIFIEAGLHQLARIEPVSLPPRQQLTLAAGARRRMARRLALVAAVLSAVGAIAVLYFVGQDSRPLARVASGNVLVDGQSQDRIPEGSSLRVTGSAPAVIRLSDGSLATLDPDTQITLRGRMDSTRQVLRLTAGGGQFHVPHGGGQFRIDTPVGSVTVLGTEFTAVLRSPRSLFLSVAAGTVRFDGEGETFTLGPGQSRTFTPKPDRPRPDVAANAQVMDGYIHSVDLKTLSFVLGGKDGSQTTFRVPVKVEGNREAARLLLDGQKATFETAIQPNRKASVTYVTVADDDLWVWQVDVTSAAQ